MTAMPPGLRLFLRVVDIGMIAYWAFSVAACAGLVRPAPDLMYEGYGTASVDAWNWSFAPLDLAFAVTGLLAVRTAARGDDRWRTLAIISLVLTMCAGGMAVSYWALLGSFQPSWWAVTSFC